MVDLMYRGLPPFKAFKIMEFVRKGRASKPKDHEEWEGYVKLMHEYNVEDWFIDSCAKIKYMFLRLMRQLMLLVLLELLGIKFINL